MSFSRLLQKSKTLFKDSWLPEILLLGLSLLSLAATLLLLLHFDGKPIFVWHEVTLNALVSTFSTISKSALLFAVSACLSQWKYISFSRNRRRLREFDLYDEASRGPQGSLVLLWNSRLWSVSLRRLRYIAYILRQFLRLDWRCGYSSLAFLRSVLSASHYISRRSDRFSS